MQTEPGVPDGHRAIPFVFSLSDASAAQHNAELIGLAILNYIWGYLLLFYDFTLWSLQQDRPGSSTI